MLCGCNLLCRIDPRELDVVLSEVALISARSELYMRFMRRRALVSCGGVYPDTSVQIFSEEAASGCK